MDKETGKASALSGASLEGAEFEVKYYDAVYTSLDDVKEADLTKTWTFKTNKNGVIDMQGGDDYFVSGDTLYYAKDGKTVTFPIGSYVIKETKAPKGYLVNSEENLSTVTGQDSDGEYVKTYNMITSEDAAIYEQVQGGDLEFVKKDQGEDRLANCVFKVTSNTTGESHIIVTDPNGKFSTKGTLDADTANKNDEAYNAETGELDESKLSYEYGIWFGQESEDESHVKL